jgi:hypothetical protein
MKFLLRSLLITILAVAASFFLIHSFDLIVAPTLFQKGAPVSETPALRLWVGVALLLVIGIIVGTDRIVRRLWR